MHQTSSIYNETDIWGNPAQLPPHHHSSKGMLNAFHFLFQNNFRQMILVYKSDFFLHNIKIVSSLFLSTKVFVLPLKDTTSEVLILHKGIMKQCQSPNCRCKTTYFTEIVQCFNQIKVNVQHQNSASSSKAKSVIPHKVTAKEEKRFKVFRFLKAI